MDSQQHSYFTMKSIGINTDERGGESDYELKKWMVDMQILMNISLNHPQIKPSIVVWLILEMNNTNNLH